MVYFWNTWQYLKMKLKKNKNEPPTNKAWQKWRFSAPQTHLWLIKIWFSASTFVVKIATFAKPQNVSGNIMTQQQLRTEYQRLFFPETISVSIETIELYADFLINFIYHHHKTVYKNKQENEARLIAQMIFSKTIHIKKLLSGVEFNSKTGIKLNKIIDPTVIACLVRNIYETVAIFNLIFRNTAEGDARNIVYNLWVIAGLKYRQRFESIITTEENREKLEREKNNINEFISEIHSTTFYKQLDERNKNKIDTKIKEKDYLVHISINDIKFLSWQDLAQIIGVKNNGFEAMYTYFSLYAHPSNVSVFQYNDIFQRQADFEDLTAFNLKYLFFLLSIFCGDYINLFPKTIEIFNRQTLISQIIMNAHNLFIRGDKYLINNACLALR